MKNFTESTIEETTLEWSKEIGHTIVFGNDIAPKNMLASLRDGMSMLRVMRGEVMNYFQSPLSITPLFNGVVEL